MRTPTALLASVLLATVSCNGSITEGGGGSGTTGATTGASSSSGGGGASVTLTLDAFTVPPGGEIYKCQNFANPFGGGDAQVAGFESHMAKGSHHMLVFYKEGATSGPLKDCSGLEFAATPYSTQLPDDSLDFPAGVAALIPKTTGLRIQSHYLNVTSAPITAHVEVTFHLAAEGTVKQQAGVMFVVQPDFMIAPHTTQSVVNYDCAIPQDMNVIKAGSHMHKHGTDFVATVAGSELLHTTTWDDPAPAKFSPPRALKKGDALHFACTFDNNSAQTLTFGESASTNEMCIFVGAFYPVPAGQATIICP